MFNEIEKLEIKIRKFLEENKERYEKLDYPEKIYLILNYHFDSEVRKLQRKYRNHKYEIHYYYQNIIIERKNEDLTKRLKGEA